MTIVDFGLPIEDGSKINNQQSTINNQQSSLGEAQRNLETIRLPLCTGRI
jgi:hypothetical protein